MSDTVELKVKLPRDLRDHFSELIDKHNLNRHELMVEVIKEFMIQIETPEEDEKPSKVTQRDIKIMINMADKLASSLARQPKQKVSCYELIDRMKLFLHPS